ncbi:UvrD-helicase domain-containing protein [Solimonas sp. K1W22B-7]|uniref:UvrD-helicase domain-containing protein n=1 Tax=Solimonas sp. K1W22B-7 TaxID=2303331 RepID=UPI0013C4818C|nr:UvrD-helicase domain-containing protein [Solimonas sp. K1W22B-7]
MSEIADQAQRRRALDPAASFIVQAPAGSGKTELLTQRVLRLLAGVDEPEEVVAITFTRKAAAEMRHRVFAAVQQAQSGEPPADAHRRETWQLARAALARSQERGWGLQDNPQRLRILTIDALCAQVTQQAPLTAGFGGRVQVAEHPQLAYREAARATIELIESSPSLAPPVARVLAHFDNRSSLLEAQLVMLLGRRDQWISYTLADDRAERTRAVLESALAEFVSGSLAEVEALLPRPLRIAWLDSAAYASSNLHAANPGLPLHALRDGHWPSCDAAGLAGWQALTELVLKRDGDWRRIVNATNGFPAGKSKAEKAERDPPRTAHLELIDALREVPGLCQRLAGLRQLPPPCYSDAQWEILQALLDTLRLAATQLRLVFMARGEVDFTEVASQAVAALGGAEGPSDLALRMDYRIRHLLVDEFQDTSALQWQLLARLTAGWQGDDGRTLFVVGDPMQSIYRFRNADVGLFMDARNQGIGSLRLQALQLSCNFRSEAGVVDWVNQAFAQVLPAQEDRERGAAAHARAVATRPAAAAPAVTVHALGDTEPAAEAARVLELVRAAHAADPAASVAVLVRSRGHLEAITPALREAGIAYRAVDIEGLAARPAIEDLRSLTRALLHPADRIAWLALLRAPCCGLALSDLLPLVEGLPPDMPMLAGLRDPARIAQLSADGRTRLERCMAVLEPALAQQGRKPLRRWVESAWLALGGPACAAPRDLADAQVFLARLDGLARGPELPDLEALDLALAELKASADGEAGETLSLMTIHKSKGLEFDVVIVPGLGRGTRSDTRPLVAWATRRGADGGERLLLAPLHASGDEDDPIFDFVLGLQAEKQLHEDARLLYVAATRARRALHLVGALEAGEGDKTPEPPSRSLLARLWPAVAQDFAALAGSAHVPQSEAPRRPPAIRRLPAQWSAPPLPAGPVSADGAAVALPIPFDWAGEAARAVGISYHRWMQQIAREGVERWDEARVLAMAADLDEMLAAEGVPAARCEAARQRVQQALAATLQDPRGRWLLQAHAQARSEWELTAVLDGQPRRFKLDRSFVDAEGQRWVVDFKTSVHEGGNMEAFLAAELQRYRAQLEGYRAALRGLDGSSPRLALYLPLMADPAHRWVELP